MTLIDSVDSIIMLYSYAGFPDRSFALFEKRVSQDSLDSKLYPEPTLGRVSSKAPSKSSQLGDQEVLSSAVICEGISPSPGMDNKSEKIGNIEEVELAADDADSERARLLRVKRNAMSSLSILLTLMSILVAFTYVLHSSYWPNDPPNLPLCSLLPIARISLIEIMGLIGDNCTPCQNAANAPDGGGLAGSWWRGWGRVSAMCHAAGVSDVNSLTDNHGYRRTTCLGILVQPLSAPSSSSLPLPTV